MNKNCAIKTGHGEHEGHPCLHDFMKCLIHCEECLTLCINSTNKEGKEKCMSLLRDCIDVCNSAIKFVARGSCHAKHILKECKEICEEVAAECEKIGDMHCADACKECAKACTEME